jgi:hypothetical protein
MAAPDTPDRDDPVVARPFKVDEFLAVVRQCLATADPH